MTAAQTSIPVLSSIAALAGTYDAWLCDIWGVMHNGERPFPGAKAACSRFREGGGVVVLISNSPRPGPGVARQLARIGVSEAAWDAIVTSGDTTRQVLSERGKERVFHLGPERDKPLLEGLDLAVADDPGEAGYVLCSGLYDDTVETPDAYAEMLALMKARGLEMVCANPDHQVERGGRLIYCAGALAAAYEKLGGKVVYTGKPYPPIYRVAIDKVHEAKGAEVPKSRILCIGDGVETDIAGAAAAGLDAVFIPSALHMGGAKDGAPLDEAALAALFSGREFMPVAAQPALRW